jgi:hypothetical protein
LACHSTRAKQANGKFLKESRLKPLFPTEGEWQDGNYVTQHTAEKFMFATGWGRGLPVPMVGLVVLVLAEIFRQGLRLEEDAQLTV